MVSSVDHVGDPAPGAPNTLNWLVNGVQVLGVELSRLTGLLREWPSVAQLLPRYRAVRDTTTADRSWYPYELPIRSLGASARATYELHCDIERAWRDMPRGGPEMVACIGWSHKTPDAAFWDGKSATCLLPRWRATAATTVAPLNDPLSVRFHVESAPRRCESLEAFICRCVDALEED